VAAGLIDEVMDRGGLHKFRVEAYNARTLALVDITTYTNIWSTIKTVKTDADPGLLQLTLVSGIALIDGPNGLLEVTIPDTFLGASGTYGVTQHLYIDVKGKDASGGHWMLATGRLTIRGDVTRAT